MTREEAISIIEELIWDIESSYVDCADIEALRIAIKALSEPERQRGAWIEYSPEHGKCPFCGNQVDLLGGKANTFCGECGADMREAAE